MTALRAVNLVQNSGKNGCFEVVLWSFRRQIALKRRFLRFTVAEDPLARGKMHHLHPRGRYLFFWHRTAAGFHGIFAFQKV